jgi:septal ring factor EnvC (AmiA/AmiB activator)
MAHNSDQSQLKDTIRIMKPIALTIPLAALFLGACESPVVDRSELVTVQRQLEQSKQALEETRQTLEETKQALRKAESNRYQVFSRGYRTWRLDTGSGSTCLLLTTTEDWKKPETTLSGCHD